MPEQRFYNDTDYRQCNSVDDDGLDCAAPEGHVGPHTNVQGEWVDEARGGLADTSGCEVAPRCATCSAVDGLAVRTATAAVGVICLTLCPTCNEARKLPRHVGMAELVTMSFGHRVHLGVTADEMAAFTTQTDHTVFHGAGGTATLPEDLEGAVDTLPTLTATTRAAVSALVDASIEREYGRGDVTGIRQAAHAALATELDDDHARADILLRILTRDGLAVRICQCRQLHPHGCPHGSASGSIWCARHYESDVPPLAGALLCGTCHVGEHRP